MNRTFYIAGVQFRPRAEIDKAAKEMKVGDKLKLVPEPDNKFDSNAVRIFSSTLLPDNETAEWTFLGYVPKKYSSEVAALLEIGVELECIVGAVTPSAKTYEMFNVTIKEVLDEAEESTEDYLAERNSEGD